MQESLFSYKYNTTLIHKTPALLKIIFLCFVSIRLFSQNNNSEITNSFLQCGFYFFIGCILFFIGKINFTIIKKLLFIPLIFRNWTKIQNAIKARSVKNSKNIFIKINNLFQSFSTLLSYLLNTAENTRKAILNREKYLAK